MRVEAHLAHARADLCDAAHHLVAQHRGKRRTGPRGCRAAPRCAPPPRRRARRAPLRRRGRASARSGRRRRAFCGQESTSRLRARVIATYSRRRISATWASVLVPGALPSAARRAPARWSGARPGMRLCWTPSTYTQSNSRPLAPCIVITFTACGWPCTTASSSRSPAADTATTYSAKSRDVRPGGGAPTRRPGRRTWRCSPAARATRSSC